MPVLPAAHAEAYVDSQSTLLLHGMHMHQHETVPVHPNAREGTSKAALLNRDLGMA